MTPAAEVNASLGDLHLFSNVTRLVFQTNGEKKNQTAKIYPEDLIMTPHQNKNFQQIRNLIPSIYMHSNNVFKKHFLP